jgi:hypothetical protein
MGDNYLDSSPGRWLIGFSGHKKRTPLHPRNRNAAIRPDEMKAGSDVLPAVDLLQH